MIITGISLTDFEGIVSDVSQSVYDGNITIHPNAAALSSNRFRARIRAIDSGASSLPAGYSAPGARRAAGTKQQRGPWACWHAYRDVIAAVFALNPNARIYTKVESYIGLDDFEANYPATGYRNVGSAWYPNTLPALCDCDGIIRGDDA